MIFHFTTGAGLNARNQMFVELSNGQLTGPGPNARALVPLDSTGVCANCHADGESALKYVRVAAPQSLSTSVVTETILAALPGYPSAAREFLPPRGRRLLAFTDSRQGAVRLGPQELRTGSDQPSRARAARMARTSPSGI